jgi:hypothetical protein
MKTIRSTLIALVAVTAAPIADAHAFDATQWGVGLSSWGPVVSTTDPCGVLNELQASVIGQVQQARGLMQKHIDVFGPTDPYPTAASYSLGDLNYILNTVYPAYEPYCDTATTDGTPAGSAWAYQVHSGIIYDQGYLGELTSAEHWALVSATRNHSAYAFEAIGVMVQAHNAATTFDQTAMLCYLSYYGPYHQ